MDIEKLTRSQIVLLALLVSFVSAIASSIVTMRLLDEAPSEAVPHIVNRVVERTVERVVTPVQAPAEEGTTQQEASKEKVVEKTIVVREEELVPSAVEWARSLMVAVYKLPETHTSDSEQDGNVSASDSLGTTTSPSSPSSSGTSTSPTPSPQARFMGFGIVVARDTVLVPDRIALPDAAYEVRWGNASAKAHVAIEGVAPFALLTVEGAELPYDAGAPPALLDVASLKLGQSVIVVGGEQRPTITPGIVATLPVQEAAEEATGEEVSPRALFPEVAIAPPPSTPQPGAVVVSLFKELVAMFDGKVYRVVTPQGLRQLMDRLREEATAPQAEDSQTTE